jgi:hypothetical protein
VLPVLLMAAFVRVSRAQDSSGAAASEATANAAYASKQWASCAAQWEAIGKRASGAKAADALYNAACCHARDGKSDLAFDKLDAAIAAGLRDDEGVEHDQDLAGLHRDQRWTKSLQSLRARIAAWESSLKAPRLRRQLLAMAAEDQAARAAWLAKKPSEPGWKELSAKVAVVDKKNTVALRAAMTEYGWPANDIVGEDGARAAWLLAQHADRDLPLQREVLARMKPLVERGQVSATDYAYLYDRVAVAEHRKQRYGTQFDGSEPFPIEDAAHVDERRRAVGLSTLAEYRKGF